MRRALIDTNVYLLAMHGEAEIIGTLQQLDEIGFTVISLGELLSGFRCGDREIRHRAELGQFLDSPRVRLLVADAETTEFYAGIVQSLTRAGTQIPVNDIWIAALAQQHGLPLFCRDSHFAAVAGLVLVP